MNKTTVYIFLFDGFSDWEIAFLTPELQKSEKIELNYFSVDGNKVTSMGGLNIMPNYSLDQIDASQIFMLILPGGAAWENNTINTIDTLVEQLNADNKPIAAICGATVYLAEKGYLNELAHTSNALFYLEHFSHQYDGKASYKDELSVTDKNVITANGIAPIEFTREIMRKLALHEEKEINKWFQLFKYGVWTE